MNKESLLEILGKNKDLSKVSETEINILCEDLEKRLSSVFDTLTPREAKILLLSWGLEDGKEWSLDEMATEFKVTRERIRQIDAKALRKLRHPSRSCLLKDFLD